MDKGIALPYAKLVHYWERKGESRYDLSTACSMLSFIPIFFGTPPPPDKIHTTADICLNFCQGMMQGYELRTNIIERKRVTIKNNFQGYAPMYYRLGAVLIGAGFITKVAFNVADHIAGGRLDYDESLRMGMAWLLNASSAYIRSVNTNILDELKLKKFAEQEN
jgi:hypothetical protein